jgi:hypothetical protein
METKYFEEYQKQFSEWQKKFFDTWLEFVPNGKNSLNFTENFEKALKWQEEAVMVYLENQQKTSEMMIKAQKQYWAEYFEMMRKTPTLTAS